MLQGEMPMSNQRLQMQTSPSPVLLAVVEVSVEDRVKCSEPGCGHAVHKAIHVVQENGAIAVLGSSCFEKRFGPQSSGRKPRYTSSAGRVLSAEERQLLVENAAELIARFESHLQAQRKRLDKDAQTRVHLLQQKFEQSRAQLDHEVRTMLAKLQSEARGRLVQVEERLGMLGG